MGIRSDEVLEIQYDDLADYLRRNGSVYMQVGDKLYYLTDVNRHYWRAQDTSKLNDKGHYCDCSALVPSVGEFMVVDLGDGRSIQDVFDEAVFYESINNPTPNEPGEEIITEVIEESDDE